MGKILMVYASQSGNTEQITDIIAHYLQSGGHDVEVKSFDFDDIDVDGLQEYDAVLIGTYTWDDGEMPYEVEDFYIDLKDADLTGIITGVYGSADSFYDTFGGAIDLVWNYFTHLGATVIEEKLKIDLTPDAEDEKRCVVFAQEVSTVISGKHQPVT